LIGEKEKLFLSFLEGTYNEIEKTLKDTRFTDEQRLRMVQTDLGRLITNLRTQMETAFETGYAEFAELAIKAREDAAIDLLTAEGFKDLKETFSLAYSGVPEFAVRTMMTRRDPNNLNISGRVFKLTENTYQMLQKLLIDGLTTGEAAEKVAKRFRVMLVKADNFTMDELADLRKVNSRILKGLPFGQKLDVDLRTVKDKELREKIKKARALRQQVNTVRYQTMRLVRSEFGQGFHESGILAAQASPLVAAIQWRLSNSHPKFDVCDMIESWDGYGLGSGVYPVTNVPPLPHPSDLCYTIEILRHPADIDQPKPDPKRRKLPKEPFNDLKSQYVRKEGETDKDKFTPAYFKRQYHQFLNVIAVTHRTRISVQSLQYSPDLFVAIDPH
jgi:uncharacterized protein YoaH (UPF0181 family)